MARLSLISLAVLGLSKCGLGEQLSCGPAQYDPTQYVCYDNQFLCPIISGEPLSYCSGACYSQFQYACAANVLTALPPVDSPFTLVASNPSLPVHGRPVSACNRYWTIGGQTCTYCPGGVSCPPDSNLTAVSAGGGGASMAVSVPGGQQVYLDASWNVGYTQAHSASVPPGATLGGLVAYKGGGFVNLNGDGRGWVACPPTASGGIEEDGWKLVARNASNGGTLASCYGVNLKVEELEEGTVGAWQYA